MHLSSTLTNATNAPLEGILSCRGRFPDWLRTRVAVSIPGRVRSRGVYSGRTIADDLVCISYQGVLTLGDRIEHSLHRPLSYVFHGYLMQTRWITSTSDFCQYSTSLLIAGSLVAGVLYRSNHQANVRTLYMQLILPLFSTIAFDTPAHRSDGNHCLDQRAHIPRWLFW